MDKTEDVVELLDYLATSSALSNRVTEQVKEAREFLKKKTTVSNPTVFSSSYVYDKYHMQMKESILMVPAIFRGDSSIEVLGVVPGREAGKVTPIIIYRYEKGVKRQFSLDAWEFPGSDGLLSLLKTDPRKQIIACDRNNATGSVQVITSTKVK